MSFFSFLTGPALSVAGPLMQWADAGHQWAQPLALALYVGVFMWPMVVFGAVLFVVAKVAK